MDLEGAKSGVPENLITIQKIIAETDLFVEVGGGIRSMETIEAIRLECGKGTCDHNHGEDCTGHGEGSQCDGQKEGCSGEHKHGEGCNHKH